MHPLPGSRARAHAVSIVLALTLVACGGSGSSAALPPSDVGELQETPQGALFFVDPHASGRARSLRLAETAWARLVDVYDRDAGGVRGAAPLLSDLPVRPEVVSDGADYTLELDALGRSVLEIHHARGTPEFEAALRHAAQDLPTITPRGEASSATPPTLLPRNAALVLRFDDLLHDGPDMRLALAATVRLVVGYPPRAFHQARVFFDASHGALHAGEWRPTRVVIDVTPTPEEPGAPGPLGFNAVGLPSSIEGTDAPNVSVRVATRQDIGSGVFRVLENLSGRTLDPLENGPSATNLTGDVLRAMRSGNASDPNNGFLPDTRPPRLVGRFAARVLRALGRPAERGTYELDLGFTTACAKAPAIGELIETELGFLEVTQAATEPDDAGVVPGVVARMRDDLVPPPSQLIGGAHLWTRLTDDSSVAPACFVEVLGALSPAPGAEILPEARFRLRFDEPMVPEGLDALEGLRLHAGDQPGATASVVGQVFSAPDSAQFDFVPRLPLAHAQGSSERYTLELVSNGQGVSDLAGNALARGLPALEFALAPAAASVASGGLSLRFASLDEYGPAGVPDGRPDLRGLFVHDAERGALRGRPVVHRSWPIDGTSGLTSLMLRLPVGIREPLGRMGSRLQTLWRYADAGMRVEDESHYDVDVEGVAWAPFGGGVISDFYEAFELRLGHGVQLPDEGLAAPNALAFPLSGLLDAPAEFDDNVLEPGGARAVNLRALGYRIDPSARFLSTTGTTLMPFPVQVGGALQPFTWRDTALQGVGGSDGGGIPLEIERRIHPGIEPGSVAFAGEVPSFGLPLLIELAAFPSDRVLGLNDFQVAIASPGQLFPTFRVHSTGGHNVSGAEVRIDPDQSAVPRGGFDPTSSPAGQATRSADPALYFGQLDTVTRLTRVHSAWFDTESEAPDYSVPLVTPAPVRQPAGTEVVLEFRGASGFLDTDGAELDAGRLDPYGDVDAGFVAFPGSRAWTRDIDALDGLRYLQVRITLVSDVESGLSPALDSLAIAFTRE